MLIVSGGCLVATCPARAGWIEPARCAADPSAPSSGAMRGRDVPRGCYVPPREGGRDATNVWSRGTRRTMSDDSITASAPFVPVIMAGGQGQCLRPLATADRPKEVLDLE